MGIEFKLTQEQPPDGRHITIFHVAGWLDAQSEPLLVKAVQEAKDAGAQYVLLELSGVPTITSAGIRGLQQAYQILTPKGDPSPQARLKLCCALPNIYHVLSITGVLINAPMYEAVDSALASIGK